MLENEQLIYEKKSYYGGGYLRVPRTIGEDLHHRDTQDEDYVLISALDADRLPNNAKADSLIPEWWFNVIKQAEEVRESRGKSLLCWYPDDTYLLTGAHSESFVTWCEVHFGDENVEFDRFLNSTAIIEPKFPEDTNLAMSNSGIQATSVAAAYVSPETERSVQLKKFAKMAESEGFKLPDPITFPTERTFLKHQEPVVKTLAWNHGGLLGDDVGSGKSSMFFGGFLSFIQKRHDVDGIDYDDLFPLVVVTKSALIATIEIEFRKWFSSAKTYIVKGSKDVDIPKDVHAIFVPINSLKNNLYDILDTLPSGVIFDESHMIKSLAAQRTQAAVSLAKGIKDINSESYIVCASATPMPNRPEELYAQLLITGMIEPIIEYAEQRQRFPLKTKTKTTAQWQIPVDEQKKFEIRYCQGKPGYFGWDSKGASNQNELSKLLYANGMIRRKKSEFITPLPMLYQNVLIAKMSEEYYEKYLLAEEEFKEYMVKITKQKGREEGLDEWEIFNEVKDKISKVDKAEAIMKMTSLSSLVGEAKVDAAVRWIHRFFAKDPIIMGKDTNRNKLVVFAHHKNVQKALIEHPELQKYGLLSVVAGSKNIDKIVDAFQDPNSGKNLIICYSEAREGLTLTAARDVLMVELPFLPSYLIQAAGRVWARFSEDYPPHEGHLHLLSSNTSIDKYLEQLIRDKGILNKQIIDGEMATDIVNDAESGESKEREEEKFLSEAYEAGGKSPKKKKKK